MVSGIKVNEQIAEVYKTLKLRKLKGLILQINEKATLEVDKEFPTKEFTYESFAESFPTDDSRFGIVELDYETDDGRRVYDIIFILWCPIQCKAMRKMKYSTSSNSIAEELGAIKTSFQLDDPSQLTYDSLVARVKKALH